MQKETFKEWNSNSGYGMCRLSLLSVFREPAIYSGLSTQLLFGELYEIVEIGLKDQWLKIDGLEEIGSGWILSSQHHSLTKDEFDFFVQSPRQIVSQGVGVIKFRDNTLFLLPGSQIHAGQNEIFEWEESIKFNGISRPFEEKTSREAIRDTAMAFLNAPYLPGGRSLFGIGESAWLNLVFKINGIVLPNNLQSLLQINKNQSISAVQIGDIIIFGDNSGIPFQVGLYLGENNLLWVRDQIKIGSFHPKLIDKNFNKKTNVQILQVKNIVD